VQFIATLHELGVIPKRIISIVAKTLLEKFFIDYVERDIAASNQGIRE